MSTLSATIQADTSGFNAAIEKAEKELKQFDKTNKNLTDTIKKNNVVTDQQVKSFRNSISAMQKATSGANDYKQASSKLSKEIEKMKILYQSLNKEAQQGFFGTTLLKQIQATEAKVQQFNKNISKTKGDLKSITTNSPFKDMLSQVTGMITPLNNVSALVGRLGPAAAAAATSFTVISDAIKESETGMDLWQGSLEGFKNMYSELLRMLRGESSNILGGFSLGMASYNASDALGTFLSLNAGWKARLEEQVTSLKLKKAEGGIISDEELNKAKKDITDYYDKLVDYITKKQQAKKNELIGSKGSAFMKGLVGEFMLADDKDSQLNEAKKDLDIRLKKRDEWVKDYLIKHPTYNINDVKELYPGEGEIKELQRFINAESTLLAPIAAIQADLNKADKERARVLKELQEVVSKEKTGSTTSKITKNDGNFLEGSIAILEKQKNKLEKKFKEVTTDAERRSINKQIEDLNYKLTALNLTEKGNIANISRDLMRDIYQLYSKEIEGTPAFLSSFIELSERYRGRYPAEAWKGLYILPKEGQDIVKDLYSNLYANFTPGTEEFIKENNRVTAKIKDIAAMYKDYWWVGNIEETYEKLLGYISKTPLNSPDFRTGNSELIPMKPNVDVLNKHLKQLTITTSAVNDLASAWNNLWSVIDLGNDTINSTMQALGSSVQNFANMFVNLAEIQVAASKAEALGKGTASAAGLPFPYNLAAMATVIATVTSMFASFASIGKFAEGGIVGGSRSIGDYNIARVNSGEMILNGSQQKRLFHLLNSNGTAESSVQKVELVVRGKDLVGAIDNYNRQINRVR